MKRTNPEKNCFLEYDKLYIDHKIFVYNEAMGQVVEQSESQRFGEMYSRPGTQMMMAGTSMGEKYNTTKKMGKIIILKSIVSIRYAWFNELR